MPVILNPDSYDLWLDPGMKDVGRVSELLRPYDAQLMKCYPVTTRVNNVINDDEECSKPAEPAETQGRFVVLVRSDSLETSKCSRRVQKIRRGLAIGEVKRLCPPT